MESTAAPTRSSCPSGTISRRAIGPNPFWHKQCYFACSHDAARNAFSPLEDDPDQPLGATFFRVDLYDGYFKPTVCLDPVHKPVDFASRRYAGSSPSDLFYPDRSPNVPFPVLGLPGRIVRAPGPALARRGIIRRELALCGQSQYSPRPLS